MQPFSLPLADRQDFYATVISREDARRVSAFDSGLRRSCPGPNGVLAKAGAGRRRNRGCEKTPGALFCTAIHQTAVVGPASLPQAGCQAGFLRRRQPARRPASPARTAGPTAGLGRFCFVRHAALLWRGHCLTHARRHRHAMRPAVGPHISSPPRNVVGPGGPRRGAHRSCALIPRIRNHSARLRPAQSRLKGVIPPQHLFGHIFSGSGDSGGAPPHGCDSRIPGSSTKSTSFIPSTDSLPVSPIPTGQLHVPRRFRSTRDIFSRSAEFAFRHPGIAPSHHRSGDPCLLNEPPGRTEQPAEPRVHEREHRPRWSNAE